MLVSMANYNLLQKAKILYTNATELKKKSMALFTI